MAYQKKPLGIFHLDSLGISKRQLPKMLWFRLDLNDKINQMNFLCHKLYNSDYHDGFIVKIHPQKVISSMPIFPQYRRAFTVRNWGRKYTS